jgi:hypothetical protein
VAFGTGRGGSGYSFANTLADKFCSSRSAIIVDYPVLFQPVGGMFAGAVHKRTAAVAGAAGKERRGST